MVHGVRNRQPPPVPPPKSAMFNPLLSTLLLTRSAVLAASVARSLTRSSWSAFCAARTALSAAFFARSRTLKSESTFFAAAVAPRTAFPAFPVMSYSLSRFLLGQTHSVGVLDVVVDFEGLKRLEGFFFASRGKLIGGSKVNVLWLSVLYHRARR